MRYRRSRDLPAAHQRRPRVRVVPDRRREGGGRGGGRPAARGGRVPLPRPLPRRPDRARPRDPHPRGPRLGARAPRRGHGRRHPRPPRRRRRVRPRPDRGRLVTRPGGGAGGRGPHAGPPARAHLFRAGRHQPRPGALGRADRRLPLRRRRRPPRPGHRARGRRARHLPQPPRGAAGPTGRDRGLAGAPGRLDVRRPGHEHEGELHDRLRAGPQPPPGGRGRGRLRAALARRARPPAAELPPHRRHEPRARSPSTRRSTAR